LGDTHQFADARRGYLLALHQIGTGGPQPKLWRLSAARGLPRSVGGGWQRHTDLRKAARTGRGRAYATQFFNSPRCGATTRSAAPCRSPAVKRPLLGGGCTGERLPVRPRASNTASSTGGGAWRRSRSGG